MIKLSNGDLVNPTEILYVHPSKTEESAYIYIKGLKHHSNGYPKMIEITLKDYDMLVNTLTNNIIYG